MGTFCFDHFEHPLLWCDEKKRVIERKNAEESTKLWRRKKAEEFAKREQDKKEYHDMNVTHCPWGRPGGGAPNLDVRMRNITDQGLHPTPKYSVRSSALPPCRVNVGPSGGGAHIRSAADRLYITLKDHPSMSFRNKGHVDIELRYKKSPKGKPKMHLDKIVVTEKPECRAKKKHKEARHDPWGKPGPGGAPWRNPKTVGSSFMRSLGWTNNELLKELDQENPQTAPSPKKLKEPKPEIKKCCPMCSCNCNAASTSSTEQRRPSPLKKQDSRELDRNGMGAGGNGHSGGGGNEQLTQYKPSSTLKHGGYKRVCSKKEPLPRTSMASGGGGGGGGHGGGGGGVELVPLLARRRGMHRPVSLSSTDVTKQTDANRWTNSDVQYLNELKRQMIQKRRRIKISKEQERDDCNQHFQTFERFWGRPGHGAPRDIKYKLNLDDLLYGVPIE